MAAPPSPADFRRRLRALDELAAGVEVALHDCGELIAGFERSHKREALRISREDLVVLNAQWEVIDYCRRLIEAEAEQEVAA
jgi:hypothetical protein